MKQDTIKFVLRAVDLYRTSTEDYNEIFGTDITHDDIQEVTDYLEGLIDVKERQ